MSRRGGVCSQDGGDEGAADRGADPSDNLVEAQGASRLGSWHGGHDQARDRSERQAEPKEERDYEDAELGAAALVAPMVALIAPGLEGLIAAGHDHPTATHTVGTPGLFTVGQALGKYLAGIVLSIIEWHRIPL
jgi:hypothetical protein